MSDLLPLFPLGTVLFPGMVLPLRIFEQRYRTMFARRVDDDPIFGVVLTLSGREVGDQPEVYSVGTAASLLKAVRYDDGCVDLAVRGGRRFRLLAGHWDEGYLTATIEWIEPGERSTLAGEQTRRLAEQVTQAFSAYLDALERTADLRIERAELTGDPVMVAFTICSLMPFDTAQRQRLLEAMSPVQLLEVLLATIRRDRDLLLATGIGGAALDHPGSRFSAN
ncbi:MAG: LON peptidase substrate-binding domain-containing protein [Chloroflexia bacterium]|nr:LON peptidase substrate-binding domain-containing protein [Chloroflexia bacterium]